MTQAWAQPAPTKAFAVYLEKAWYGEGDTAPAAWLAAHRGVNAAHCRYGAAMYARLRRYGKVMQTEQGICSRNREVLSNAKNV